MRRILASAALAVLLLDVTVVGVLLPTLRTDLGSSPSGGQWIMNAYLLALAIVLPLALRARVDRRLVLAAGAGATAAGAIVCATADSTSTLVVGRAIEGAGMGALIVPVAGAGAAVLPVMALALGPLLGGELAERNWWHLYFWAAAPAAVLLAAIALPQRESPADEHTTTARRELALGAALILATILLVQSEPWGVGTEFAVYVVGVGGLAGLVVAVGPERGGWGIAGGALAALAFLMPQYFELGHLIHPLRSGVRFSALTVPAVVAGVAAWRLRRLIPRAILLPAGALAVAAGAFALLWIDEHSSNVLFGAGLALVGVGCGIIAAVAQEVDQRDRLVAAAVGAALMLAVSGALFQHRQAELRSGGASFEHAVSDAAGYGSGGLMVAAAALAGVALRPRRESSAARPAPES